MKNPTLKLCVILFTILLIIAVSIILVGCNVQVVDTHWNFNRAIIFLPNGEMIAGECQSWKDFDESDMLQVKIDGVTYLTHASNVILIDD